MKKKILSIAIVLTIVLSNLIMPHSNAVDSPDLPTGGAYKLSSITASAFNAGDTISIPFYVDDITATGGLVGLDLEIWYDSTVLEPVTTGTGATLSITSSADTINSTSGSSSCNWWASGRVITGTGSDSLCVITMLEDNGNFPVTQDSVIRVTVSFKALKNCTSGNLLAYTIAATGTNSNTDSVNGSGVAIYVKAAATPKPTATPTATPTQAPTPTPSPTPTPKPKAQISGSIICSGDSAVNTKVELLKSGSVIKSLNASGENPTYKLTDVDEGSYIIRVSKTKHCPREYTVNVGTVDVTQDIEIWLYGDVNHDGVTDQKDATQILRYSSGSLSSIFDKSDANTEYRLAVGKVTSDDLVDQKDATQILRYSSGTMTSVFDNMS